MTVDLPILSGESGLSRYLNEIKQFPILSAEEVILAKSYTEHGESEAAHKLVTATFVLLRKSRCNTGDMDYQSPI